MIVRRLTAVLFILVMLGGCAGRTPTPSATAFPTLAPTTLSTATPAAPVDPTVPVSSTVDPAPTESIRPRLSESEAVVNLLPDVTLDVELFYFERWMRVHQVVTIENGSAEPWEEIVFHVPINTVSDAFFLDFMTVTVHGSVQEDVPGFPVPETVLRIPLPRPAVPGETVVVDLRYRVVIPPMAPTDWPPTSTTGWREGVVQAGEWYPALVPYLEGEGWYTWLYHPVGDPTVYPLANYTLSVAPAEPGITVASGGPQGVDENGVWRFQISAGRGIAFVASNRFEYTMGEANGIPITSYYQPEHALAGLAAAEIAAQSIVLFEELYGTYPYSSLVVAENGFFGGMEYSGLITISDYAYATYGGSAPSLLHALVSHEAAHQWWYGAVGNDQANEPWLDESLAFYSELLYLERYHPEGINWWWEKRVNVYQPSGPVDAPIYSYANSSHFITSVYGQAARFIRDLREKMGDEAFFAFLRDYYITYSGQIVTAHEFKTTAQAYTDQDLLPLFQAYFANPEP